MNARRNRLSRVGILIFSLWSSIVLADPVEDLVRAEKAYERDDLPEAIELLVRAAKQNYAPAQARLGEILISAEYNKDAVDWLRKAADQGNAAGEYGLGRAYTSGTGIEKDAGKALYWFRRAAEKDYLPAMKLLAHAYLEGDLGLAVDPDQAKFWQDKVNVLEPPTKQESVIKATGKTKQGSEK